MIGHSAGAATLRDYLHVVRRRKWIILLAAIVVPVTAGALASRQAVTYQASADVLLSRQNLAATLAGTPDPNAGLSSTEIVQTQAELARVPLIADRVLRRVQLRSRSAPAFLAQSSVAPRDNTDILSFTVTDSDPGLVVRLANAYALEYTIYRRGLDTASITDARRLIAHQIAMLRAQGTTSGTVYDSLVEKSQQLRTMAALQGSNATVVRPADGATRLGPHTKRDAVLGLILGLGLGIGLAFLRDGLDTRVRSAHEIGERLGLPLLGRIPAPPRKLRNAGRLVMIDAPVTPEAEAFRMLRTSIELATFERDISTLMVTSAVEQEGKSTTAANLAIAIARGGLDVTLVDLDLRSPYLERFFTPIRGRSGVTEVALGHKRLADALFSVPLALPDVGSRNGNGNGNGNGAALTAGKLDVLFAGHLPPDPGEFVSTDALRALLEQLRERSDVVIVDAPPMLHVGDAMALSPRVDALLVVTRIDTVRVPMLGELRRMLDATPVPKLGFIVTGAQVEDGYADSYYASTYGRYHAPQQETVR
jgi:Mrp family chromosome partitioning ATPase/capsular polysaccharide biosynthesis protein